MTRWLSVVGIGEDGIAGLTAAARTLIETAETLVGGLRHLAMVPDGPAERLAWRSPLADTVADIAARRGRLVAVLATGDPLWYGVGALLVRHFSPEEMTILPQPGAFSLAAARLGWPLAECVCLSLHGRPLDALRLHLAPRRRLLLLSHDRVTPHRVARLLAGSGWGPSRLSVFAHMGGAHEAAWHGTADSWEGETDADLNMIAVECALATGTCALSRTAGLPDDAFEHDGQLTKREIRAATLARLAPLAGEMLWDIGAGSGSIAIEWLRGAEQADAVAVERDPARAATIARNAAMLGVPGLRIVAGSAPEALAGLPQPGAVFVGGGIAEPDLLPYVWSALRPGGRFVANVVSLAGERALLDWRARHGGDLIRLAVSRAEPLGAHQVWRPLLPVIQFAAIKPG
ncbi:MAG TPA: precorrin-6y C5,15-methyltransferase (decarboxylating) subunit CbiE [Stellaceae bacterium]|nr:precorrin-6y C5,15-methyltransferase (decarboxylating) subunit CbiE [Stellaceae bacterium]